MPLRLRFAYDSGASLGYSIERLSDGLRYDFTDSTFKSNPALSNLIRALNERPLPWLGLYDDLLSSTPQVAFTEGAYAVIIHDRIANNRVLGVLETVMVRGDDSPVIPAAPAQDPWDVSLPGAYTSGKAGFILGTYLDLAVSSAANTLSPADIWNHPTRSLTEKTGFLLQTNPPSSSAIAAAVWDELKTPHTLANSFGSLLDVAVSSRSTYAGGPVASVTNPVTVGTNNDKAGYSLTTPPLTVGQIAAAVWDEQGSDHSLAGSFGSLLDAPVSTRSTYSGGPVAAVTAPVTVGTNNDKVGYSLDAAGFDAISVEPGVNARQALSPILAAAAGVVSGAETGQIVIKAGNGLETRITATTDIAGNRTSVALTLPV